MRKNLLIVSFVVCAVCYFCSCTNSMDDMLSTYNNTYSYQTKQKEAYTLDNVSGENMLRDSYAVFYMSTLCLTAPAGAASYEWKVKIGENANGEKEGKEIVISTKKDLTLYIVNSELKRWSSYKLTLTVKKDTGLTYSDTADLYVY